MSRGKAFDLTRRAFGAGLCCLPAAARAEDFALVEIAPSVFIRRGVEAEAGAANLDGIANIGFIVGEKSALVTESGGSLAEGRLDFEPASAALLLYLTALRDGARAEIDGGGSIEHAMRHVVQSERDKWKLFDDYNQRNVAEAYSELEWR